MTTYNYDQELVDYLPAMHTVVDFSTAESIRQFWSKMVAIRPTLDKLGEKENVTIENRVIPGLQGNPDIPIRVYTPNHL